MAQRCLTFDSMDQDVFPYLLFLPTDRDKLISMLNGIFGSNAKIDILKGIPACGETKIYQKDLIASLRYSNKTILKNLKDLCLFGVLHEHMEKQTGPKDVWVKYYQLDDRMTWLVLLLKSPSEIDNMEDIILQLAEIYYSSLVNMASRYGVSEKKIMEKILSSGG